MIFSSPPVESADPRFRSHERPQDCEQVQGEYERVQGRSTDEFAGGPFPPCKLLEAGYPGIGVDKCLASARVCLWGFRVDV